MLTYRSVYDSTTITYIELKHTILVLQDVVVATLDGCGRGMRHSTDLEIWRSFVWMIITQDTTDLLYPLCMHTG